MAMLKGFQSTAPPQLFSCERSWPSSLPKHAAVRKGSKEPTRQVKPASSCVPQNAIRQREAGCQLLCWVW